MIANNTRYRFRVSEERVQRFCVGDTVIFKDPEGVPAKEKKKCLRSFQTKKCGWHCKGEESSKFLSS